MLRFVHIPFALKVAAIAIVGLTALISIIQLITSAILVQQRLDAGIQPSSPVDPFYGARLSTDVSLNADRKYPFARFVGHGHDESNATDGDMPTVPYAPPV